MSKLFAFSRLPAEVVALIEQRPDSIGANCAEEPAKLCTTPKNVARGHGRNSGATSPREALIFRQVVD